MGSAAGGRLAAAVELLMDGKFDHMVAFHPPDIVAVPLQKIVGHTRTVPPDFDVIRTARALVSALLRPRRRGLTLLRFAARAARRRGLDRRRWRRDRAGLWRDVQADGLCEQVESGRWVGRRWGRKVPGMPRIWGRVILGGEPGPSPEAPAPAWRP